MRSARNFLLSLLLSAGFFVPAQAAETWKVASLEWPPFSGAKLPDGGTGVKALRDALKSQGITLQVEYFPWSRAMATAAKPDWVGFFPAWPADVTSQSEAFGATPALFRSPIVIAEHKEAPLTLHGLKDLKGKRVGTVQDYGYPQEFLDLDQQKFFKSDPAVDDLTGLKKLALKRVDGMVIDINVMKFLQKTELKADADKIAANAGWQVNMDLLLAVNKANPNYPKIFAAYAKALKAVNAQKIVDDANAVMFAK